MAVLKDMVYVNVAMLSQANRWLPIGISLGIERARLDIIRANYGADVVKCLIEMVAEWMRNCRDPILKWADVIMAIRSVDANAADALTTLQGPGFPHCLITAPIPGLNIDGVDDSELSGSATADIIKTINEAGMTEMWLEIGLFLGIPFDRLEQLKPKSDDEKVHGMVGFWMRWNYDYETFGKPSWKSLVRAIGAPAGGNARRAANLMAAAHRTGSADQIVPGD